MSITTKTRSPDLLLPQHQTLITESAILPEIAAVRGYRSVIHKTELRGLGFSDRQCRVPALLIPVRSASGEIATYQIRPDQPRINGDGKAVKYETPGGSRMAIDVPPTVRGWLGDPKRPLLITEGVRKADAAAGCGLCCIALLGVWAWRGRNPEGGKTALPDWELIALNNRDVLIVFDSDVMLKSSVHNAMARLKAFLEQRGANVQLIYLPTNGNNGKTGLDDFLAAGHGVGELMALASNELREITRHDSDGGYAGPYRTSPAGLLWAKPTREGEIPVPLTNFQAKIVGQIIEDDGIETRRFMEIEADINGRPTRFAVTANEFSGMSWPIQHLGATAVVHAGFGLRDHARSAIQLLSKNVPERTVYIHTGWRKIGEAWCYLHAGGAIGPDGNMDGVEVHLPEALRHFNLQYPQDQVELHAAVRASIALLDTAPDCIVFPLFTAIWRAAISTADFSLHLAGPTGVGKSVLAALAQQHWGAEMDGRHLPGSWSSTANALEAVAFASKDALMTVDDFAPSGTTADVARFHREADRLLRAQGNGTGRQRMRADASLRPARPPRGLLLSTGEDTPRGESLRARLFVIELSPDMLRWDKIGACQRDAARGLYANAMAGFVRWMAASRDKTLQHIASDLAELREAATTSGRHKRTPEIVANLAFGLRVFLSFAQHSGSIDTEQAEELWQCGWRALGEAAAAQATHQTVAEPTARFVQLLRAAISGGHAYVANREGGAPECAMVWGWRERRGERQPQGSLVGWLDGDDLFLEPTSSYAAAQGLARNMGDGFAISARTLHKRMHEKGLLASTEPGRATLTARRVLAGSRRTVLHFRASDVMPPETAQPDQADHSKQNPTQNGQFDGQFKMLIPVETTHGNRPENNLNCPPADPVGGLGSLGEGIDDNCSDTSDGASTAPTRQIRPCFSCGGTRFWRNGAGPFSCAVCHPPACEAAVAEWITLDGDKAAQKQTPREGN